MFGGVCREILLAWLALGVDEPRELSVGYDVIKFGVMYTCVFRVSLAGM